MPFRPLRTFSQSSEPESICSTDSTEPSSPSTGTPRLELRTSRRHFQVVGLISTLSVFVITAGSATLILSWVYAYHDPVAAGGGVIASLRNGTFVIKEPSKPDASLPILGNTNTLRILMFSALASHLVSVISMVLATVLAYRSASQWLRASENSDQPNLTPIQYGLLVQTLGSGSIMSIINSLRYASRTKRASAPRFFKEALVGVTGIYILSHIVGAVDLWLHSCARSVSIVRNIPVSSEALYGMEYDETTCGGFDKSQLPCQKLISTEWDGTHWAYNNESIYLDGFDAVSDANRNVRVEYIDDTAFLVPGPDRNFKSHTFTVKTQGLHVECENLRDRCGKLSVPILEALTPGAFPVTNCSEAGYPLIPYHTTGELMASGRDTRNIESMVMGVIGDEIGGMNRGTADFSSGWTSNPASTVLQFRWINVTALWNSGTPAASYLFILDLYATCNMTYLDVVAQYDSANAKWSIVETALSSPDLASILWTPLIFQFATDDLHNTLRTYVRSKGAATIDMLASSMAKYNMAYASSLMKFTPASNVTTPQPVPLGTYPAVATLLLVGCLYVYSLIALLLFCFACTSNTQIIFVPRELTGTKEHDKETSALEVAQSWLTDPLPFLGSLFPGKDGRNAARSAKSDPLRQVYDSDWELGKVGIGLYRGNKGEKVFGLVRQTSSQSKRHGRFFHALHGDGEMQ
ncbi:hypothetical protein FRB90_001495 [Tulasnella sp. 427]|nr:hypothetical protein FRB90_001495 [Tulasnella sp. 427]